MNYELSQVFLTTNDDDAMVVGIHLLTSEVVRCQVSTTLGVVPHADDTGDIARAAAPQRQSAGGVSKTGGALYRLVRISAADGEAQGFIERIIDGLLVEYAMEGGVGGAAEYTIKRYIDV